MKVTSSNEKLFLGIAIGSVALAIALLNEYNEIIDTSYTFLQGQIEEHLRTLFKEIALTNVNSIGYTSSGSSVISQGISIDSRIAYIMAAKFLHPEVHPYLAQVCDLC